MIKIYIKMWIILEHTDVLILKMNINIYGKMFYMKTFFFFFLNRQHVICSLQNKIKLMFYTNTTILHKL